MLAGGSYSESTKSYLVSEASNLYFSGMKLVVITVIMCTLSGVLSLTLGWLASRFAEFNPEPRECDEQGELKSDINETWRRLTPRALFLGRAIYLVGQTNLANHSCFRQRVRRAFLKSPWLRLRVWSADAQSPICSGSPSADIRSGCLEASLGNVLPGESVG